MARAGRIVPETPGGRRGWRRPSPGAAGLRGHAAGGRPRAAPRHLRPANPGCRRRPPRGARSRCEARSARRSPPRSEPRGFCFRILSSRARQSTTACHLPVTRCEASDTCVASGVVCARPRSPMPLSGGPRRAQGRRPCSTLLRLRPALPALPLCSPPPTSTSAPHGQRPMLASLPNTSLGPSAAPGIWKPLGKQSLSGGTKTGRMDGSKDTRSCPERTTVEETGHLAQKG